ncbi:MAG: hypothetical protein LBC99_05290 [Spirochaetota bacterium]|nr:hypothetical protein [Spirochaetota bacterium]
MCAIFSLVLLVLACIEFSARNTILDENVYKDFLLAPAIQKKIDNIIIQTSGLEQLRAYDETVYENIFYLMKTELIAPFTNTLPELVVQYLAGDTNNFDPVLNLHEVRGKAKWILDQAVNQKVPFFLLERMQRAVNRIFSRYVPVSMRLLPMLGVTPDMEEKMKIYVTSFHELSKKTFLIYISAFFFTVLWFVLMRKKKNFPGNFVAALGALLFCIALPITLFDKQLVEIVQTALNQSSRAAGEYQAFAGVFLPRFFERLSELLFISAAGCTLVLLGLVIFRIIRIWKSKKITPALPAHGFILKTDKNKQ